MANLNINPTRMELMRLKTRLKTTVRGHKLLKDRADEMVRQFLSLIYKNRDMRLQLESEVAEALQAFALSQALMTPQETQAAVAMPGYHAQVLARQESVVGVDVPKLKIKDEDNLAEERGFKGLNNSKNEESFAADYLKDESSIKAADNSNGTDNNKKTGSFKGYPYAFSSTASELDLSISKISKLMQGLLKLAEIEKTCDILAAEIEKIRRRVNALEHMVIPQIRQEMKRISMKLDENERSNLVRLMKVKEIISSDNDS